ncbi:MAG TPA: ATP-binding cassette domain-containing protein [Bacteroidales bacterium]|nr:ATP-binding cassette domain-containing protein [Bacteroidales bacterium]
MFYLTEKIFHELNIDLNPQDYVKNISLSQRQILSFVKAYVANAKFTIFDEPSSALTDVENDILFKIINILKSRGSSIILISHKIDRIKKISDKIVVLKNGSIIEQGDMKDFSSERIIQIIAESGQISKYPKLYFDNDNDILEVNNLNYKHSLKDLSFTLKRQEIIGVTGNANSGKNKLIESLFGMIRPDSGEIILDGNKVELKHPYEAMLEGFALVPEDKIKYSLFEHLDLTHNLTMSSLKRFSKYTILDHHIMTNVAESYISKLRIFPGNLEDNVINYSGGNQQKVIFAKSIMHFAKIYLLDEPTRGIDVATKNDIYNIMNNLLINGSSIILFSSDFNEILGMCDRILILSDGKIIAELNANDATKEEIVYYLTL